MLGSLCSLGTEAEILETAETIWSVSSWKLDLAYVEAEEHSLSTAMRKGGRSESRRPLGKNALGLP